MKIVNIKGREVLDSRGNPTVECEMALEDGSVYKSIVPSGASTGIREALELRDNDSNRYLGIGVLKAVNNINTIIKESVIGIDVLDIDDVLLSLDNTPNKVILGSNSMLAVSLCSYKYYLTINNKVDYKSPFIMCNVINGGAHSNNKLDIQEFMIIPKASNISENIRMASEIFHVLGKILKEKGYTTSVGDEGGYSPEIKFTEEALDLIILAIRSANYVPGVDIFIGLDVAASHFFKDGLYYIDGNSLKSLDLIDYYQDLIEKYPIVSIEDPFEENDFLSHATLTKRIGNKVMVVGDDLFTTNLGYLKKGKKVGACNAIIIKPNQIGTMKEVEEVVMYAKKNNYRLIFSHRSGDSEDTFIADLAIHFESDYVKFGSMSRSERTSKYNQLLRILDK
ncbi:MAG: phosphopyruvate hydratase [Bacilli bacterium]|nr:phosphopyruvate hydratase [Bacilli bacterium]